MNELKPMADPDAEKLRRIIKYNENWLSTPDIDDLRRIADRLETNTNRCCICGTEYHHSGTQVCASCFNREGVRQWLDGPDPSQPKGGTDD
jgi:hypothetical protein